MFLILLFLHSLFRWLVLISLIYTIIFFASKYIRKLPFTNSDNRIRHWTATIAHLQLLIGMVIYFESPVVSYFRSPEKKLISGIKDFSFYGLIHISMMITAIVIITLGSAFSKREDNEQKKFFLVVICYGIALLIILCAIPWPFSPLAQRPFFRNL